MLSLSSARKLLNYSSVFAPSESIVPVFISFFKCITALTNNFHVSFYELTFFPEL